MTTVSRAFVLGLSCVAGLAGAAHADDSTFIPFAQVGQSYSAAVFDDDPRVGRVVVSATIVLRLNVEQGSDAAEFFTDLALPIDPGAVVILDGFELGWSGSGDFVFEHTTPDISGVFIARRYGAETFGVLGSLSENSGVTLNFAPLCIADFNRDGQLDFFDYLDFVQAFSEGCE